MKDVYCDIEDRNDAVFDIKKIECRASKKVAAFAALLESNVEFETELEEVLSAIQENSVNLTNAEEHVMLLMEAALKKLNLKAEELDLAHSILKEKRTLILEHLKQLSIYLMTKRAELTRNAMLGTIDQQNKEFLETANVRAHLKQILKRFAIYEMYKIMTPRRIAGQTKAQNFIGNAVMRGIKAAMKNDGVTIKKAQRYLKHTMKHLPKQSQKEILKNIGTKTI